MHFYMYNGGMLNKSKELNNMTNQEKNKTLQTLNEITVLLAEATAKFEKELSQTARAKYSSIYSDISKAEESLVNINYQLYATKDSDKECA